MDVVESLTAHVRAGDVDAVDGLLRSLSSSERATAKRWFDGSRGWFRDLWDTVLPGDDDPRLAHEQRLAVYRASRWSEGLCAVALCGPVAAARRVPWKGMWAHQEEPGEASLVHLLWDAPTDWVDRFVTAASAVSLGNDARHASEVLSRVLRAVVLHHGLPAPAGRTFHLSWLAGAGRGSLLETLRRDPLVPDLVHHHLAAGHGGQEAQELPDVLAVLVQEGRLDRSRLVEQVLSLLTVQQRVSSQRVLAGLVRTLGVAPDEVPGGLPYLLGVLATSHGSVGAAVLPLALELVDDAEGLSELVSVVAGRPERKQKEVLLRGATSQRVRGAVGDEPVAAALAVLVEGEDDTAFVAKVTAVRTQLGGTVSEDEALPARLGLWDLEPVVPDVPSRSHRAADRTMAVALLHPGPRTFDAGFLDPTLQEIAEGRFRTRQLVLTARHLLRAGELSVSGTTRLFEELFLAGAMRATWTTALEIAEAACTASRRPAGLAGLLRMLAAYAVEVPDRQDLPVGIVQLAAGSGASKARQEALRLGAVLARERPEAYARRLRSAPVPEVDGRTHRGLWQPATASRPLPSSLPVPPPGPVDLAALRRRSADDGLSAVLALGADVHDGALPRPSLLLADAVRAAHELGPEVVRAALSGVERYDAGPVGEALDLWASGELTVPGLWRLALDARTSWAAQDQARSDPSLSQEERSRRLRHLPRLADEVRRGSPVLPWVMNSPTARLTFLLACESLLRAGEAPVLLSTPTWQDGSLDLDALVDRLRANERTGVGPLDLVQALHRLRPTDADRAQEIDLPPVRTVGALTDREGRTSVDATEVLRTWVAAGGLPPLRTSVSAKDGRWLFSADTPVSWDLCAAAPRPLLGESMVDHHPAAAARILPLWPDVTLLAAHGWASREPDQARGLAGLGGAFGLACNDEVLGWASLADVVRRTQLLDVVMELLAHDRLDPELTAQAAVGRCAAGTLDLERVVLSWEQVFRGGGLRGLWPLALAAAAALCDARPGPAGLPALLRLLTDHAHEVPSPAVPEGIGRLAGAGGSEPVVVEARALVAAVDRVHAA